VEPSHKCLLILSIEYSIPELTFVEETLKNVKGRNRPPDRNIFYCFGATAPQ